MERQNDLFFLVWQQKSSIQDLKEWIKKLEWEVKETEKWLLDGLEEHINNDLEIRKVITKKIYIGWGLGLGAILLWISVSSPKTFELVKKLLSLFL